MRGTSKFVTLTAVIMLAGTWSVVRGQSGGWPGTLDPSFGTGGVATTAVPPGRPDRITMQTVGGEERIVAVSAGSWTMTRHRANGALDTTFGVGGVVTKTFSKKGSGHLSGGVVVQPDNKLVVAGYVTEGGAVATLAVARYTANGGVDSSFGSGGVTVVPIHPEAPWLTSSARDIAVQADGKIVVLAYGHAPSDNYQCLNVVRLLPTGTLDATFGNGGRFIYRYPADTKGTFGNAVTLQTVLGPGGQPEQRIVIAGGGQQGSDASYLETGQVVRLNPNGTLDTTFGTAGVARTAVPLVWSNTFVDIAIDSSNRIVAAGTAIYGAPPSLVRDMLLARFQENGTPDATFGNGNGGPGTFTLHWGGQYSTRIQAIGIQPDGSILAIGWGDSGTFQAVWRFLSDGLPDYNGFGTGGWVTQNSPLTTDIALIPNTNTFVVSGSVTVSGKGNRTTTQWALWRYFY